MIETYVDIIGRGEDETATFSIVVQGAEELKVLYRVFNEAYFAIKPSDREAYLLADKILVSIETYAKDREINL